MVKFLLLFILTGCTISLQNTSNIGGTSTTDDTQSPSTEVKPIITGLPNAL